MAKPHANLPGCSGHLHMSICDLNGNNQFSNTKDGVVGNIMTHFLAGILKGLPSIMAILAPTINSYKRLVENFWAPVNVSYGFENRTTAIRIIAPPTCDPKATRIEIRVPGADVNPHLVMAVTLTNLIFRLW
jgi:glutamine synthetase